ncbi:MAG: hypothetical protein LLG42_05300 [Chloroflexi bacterium]|nr:hypothetical protein [Chloroflexota bacterium]
MKNIQQKTADFWRINSNKITLAISLIALVIFVVRGLYYVDHQIDNMDEGTYLLKGKYYLEGTYQPYEDGGPITNKGVFSFWILGLSQLITPGLRSGRLFALFLSLAMLVGLWLLIRRLSNQTWAAGILLLFSLNGFWVSMYSRALTQSVCAALITFSLLLITQKSAKIWQLSLGMALAAVTALTRQNLIPYFVLAIVYVIWQFGIRKAWIPVTTGIAFFLLFNIIYWPDMYEMMWRPYVGIMMRSFQSLVNGASSTASVVAQSDIGSNVIDHDYKITQELWVVFNTVSVYIVPGLFSLFFLITANWSRVVKSEKFKTFIFILTSFLVLSIIHLMAVFQNNNILYSLPIYPGFFLPLGLIIIPCCYEWMGEKGNFVKAAALILSIIVSCTGIGLYQHRTFSNRVMFLEVPRVRSMQILPGTTELWRSLENKFHWGYKNLEFITAAAYGLAIGIVFVLLCVVIWHVIRRRKPNLSFTRLITLCSLGAAILFSPTNYLAGLPSTTICEESVIDRLEEVGGELSSSIQPGSLIYWEYHSPVVLLYLDDIRLFPAQLNNYFYKREGGDEEALLEMNFWNDEIAEKWLLEADYVLLSEEAANNWEPLMNTKYPARFDKIDITENLTPDVDRSFLHVYKTIKAEE